MVLSLKDLNWDIGEERRCPLPAGRLDSTERESIDEQSAGDGNETVPTSLIEAKFVFAASLPVGQATIRVNLSLRSRIGVANPADAG